MAKKSNTKSKIVSAAWKLFYEQAYDATTVDEIIRESGTSRGSFYHYFDGKDALVGSLAYLFDEKYEALMPEINIESDSIELLLFLNSKLFEMIENTVDLELMKRLYAAQLLTKGEKQLDEGEFVECESIPFQKAKEWLRKEKNLLCFS